MPVGTVKPYLKHSFWGRWQEDDAEEFIPPKEISDTTMALWGGIVCLLLGIVVLAVRFLVRLEILEGASIALIMTGMILLLILVIHLATGGKKKGGEISLPGITLPILSTCIVGIAATVVIWLEDGFKHPTGPWMVAFCTLVGFITGLTVLLIHHFKNKAGK
jgi:hypothetical protein